ncbi:MAG: hypothetical protein DRI57_08455 [Deltaproteobacteria bacterium]|nr:MAG: hypothetical protein DRI57_08455 [Deltaproteobacteria bacterium]
MNASHPQCPNLRRRFGRKGEASLNPNDYEQLAADFTTICLTEYELTPSAVGQAKFLLECYVIRCGLMMPFSWLRH